MILLKNQNLGKLGKKGVQIVGCLAIIISIFAFGYVYTILQEIGIDSAGLAFFLVALIPIIIFITYQINKGKEQDKIREKQNEEAQERERLLEQYGMPLDCNRFRHLGGYNKFPNGRWLHIWKDSNYLNFLSLIEPIEKSQISLIDIHFYTIKGDVKQEVKNTGGNATLAETVIAEGMLGTAAAMKKNQVIQTSETIDERKTIIHAKVADKDSYLFFQGPELYNYLLDRLPEKEQTFVAMSR